MTVWTIQSPRRRTWLHENPVVFLVWSYWTWVRKIVKSS